MKHQHLRNNMHTSTLALSVVALILFFLPGCGKGEIPGEERNETITLEVSASPIHFTAEGPVLEEISNKTTIEEVVAKTGAKLIIPEKVAFIEDAQ